MDFIANLIALFLVFLIAKIAVYKIFFKNEIQATLERDPAATGSLSVILTYPGLHALFYYRISRALHRWRLRFLARVVSQMARLLSPL